MTREEKLYSMTMKMLVAEAEKLGIKIDKKGKKSVAVDKILACEAAAVETEVTETEVETEVKIESAPEEVDTEEATEVHETEEATETEEPATEKEQEIAEPAEQEIAEPVEKKERRRQRKEMTSDAKSLHEYVLKACEDLGGIVFIPAKDMKFRGLKAGKHMFVKYSWGNSAVVLQVRSQALGLEKPVNPCNHTFNDKYRFSEDTPENRAEIFRIMKTCYDWQLCRNLTAEEKKKDTKKDTKKD